MNEGWFGGGAETEGESGGGEVESAGEVEVGR